MNKPKKSRVRDASISTLALITAANEVMIEGNGHIEMAEVARRAEVSIGLAYHYFGSKAGLIAAVVEAFYDKLDADVLFSASSESDWLKREWERTLSLAVFYQNNPLSAVILGSLRRESIVVEIEQARIAAQVEEGTRNFQKGQRQGVIRQDIAAHDLASFVLGGVRELMRSALQRPQDQRPTAEDIAKSAWKLIVPCISQEYTLS
ncbi:TetR/AcrR family transcriptional regulator [Acinetobacter tianfuensis]|nr:TetR/AcrR family transcriptional regulator [Acinetobacter tianfuensis]